MAKRGNKQGTKSEIQAYRIKMKEMKKGLPLNYPDLIIKYKFPPMEKDEENKIKKKLCKAIYGEAYYVWANDKYLKECLIELYEKYSFFLTIYDNGSNKQ